MKRIFLFITLIFQLSITCYAKSSPSLDDLIQAEERYSQTKQENLKNIIEKAQSGDTKSQLMLGIAYKEGINGIINRDKAFYWFNLAAEQNNSDAQFYLGTLYHNGDNETPPDYGKAISWYEKAANQGQLQAQVNCANIYQFGPEAFRNIDKATFWLTKAAEQNDPIAHANLGIIAADNKNFKLAAYHLKFAAEKGYRIGQYNYGTLFLSDDRFKKDLPQAKIWLEKAAQQNLPEAQISLGRFYAWGFDEKGIDKEKAMFWLNKAKDANAITEKEIDDILAKKNN
ncbi:MULTISPECIES: tetratricopeptide repeat protein [Citrobacter]|uniref:tetratricopeptide repeat protein n=1 Tax=Citrobacter TaxID=544 RepID=UPI0005020E5D|nr:MULTISPECIES: tetratricopeptide repeat protein [Citrobacter]GAS70671.1 beta-lactamase HcpA precursor [Salmonella enterica]MDN8552219.1 tetratricopeptide repeat protein [Citrobacter werkmanii]MDN8557513.1 tetratricopeptide repeat protein [Citrobacter werkmanii]MDT0639172.1 tetratricopeptide repeat protein [Citrobacter werkmanii]MDV7072750.1 tetratricopeptide repeat protein [Citrobacter werkmanii]